MNEACNRGWDTLGSPSPMKLQVERAGVTIKCDPAELDQVLASDKGAGVQSLSPMIMPACSLPHNRRAE